MPRLAEPVLGPGHVCIVCGTKRRASNDVLGHCTKTHGDDPEVVLPVARMVFPGNGHRYCMDCKRYYSQRDAMAHEREHPQHSVLEGAPDVEVGNYLQCLERPYVLSSGPPAHRLAQLRMLMGRAQLVTGAWKARSMTALQALNTFLGAFSRPVPDGKSRRDGSSPSHASRARGAALRGNYSRMLGEIVAEAEHQPVVELEDEERVRELEKLFPNSVDHVPSEREEGEARPSDLKPLEEDELKRQILRIRRAAAPGPSGIDAEQWKVLAKDPLFLELLLEALNTLIREPAEARKCPRLHQFYIALIPKKTQGYRPVCVQELLLGAFHRAVNGQLRAGFLVPRAEGQMAFKRHAQIRAAAEIQRWIQEEKGLLSLDITNAFNSVPHGEIEAMLRSRNCGDLARGLIHYYLATRSSREIGVPETGTAQGDPLSMDLFCGVIDDKIRQMATAVNNHLIAYADDVLVGVSSQEEAAEIRQAAIREFGALGLEIKAEKCKCTLDGEPVTFMGVTYAAGEPPQLATRLRDKARFYAQALVGAAVPKHAKLHALASVLVPMVNYAPFVVGGDDRGACEETQAVIVEALSRITGWHNELALRFLVTPRSLGGCSAILPGIHYDVMQKYRESVLRGDAEAFSKMREKATPEEIFLQLPEEGPGETIPIRTIAHFVLSGDLALLHDGEFEELAREVAYGFGYAGRPSEDSIAECRFCGYRMGPKHEESCTALGTRHGWRERHDEVVYGIRAAMPSAFRGEVAVAGPDGKFPDLPIAGGVADVVVCRHGDAAKEYAEKRKKYERAYGEVHPYVFTTRCEVHLQTVRHLIEEAGGSMARVASALRAAGFAITKYAHILKKRYADSARIAAQEAQARVGAGQRCGRQREAGASILCDPPCSAAGQGA